MEVLDRRLDVALALVVVAEPQVRLGVLRLHAHDLLEVVGRLLDFLVLKTQQAHREVGRNERRRDLEDSPVLHLGFRSLVARHVRARQRVAGGDVAWLLLERRLELADLRGGSELGSADTTGESKRTASSDRPRWM